MKLKPKPKPKKITVAKSVACPSCRRVHNGHAELGAFCCTSCLQVAIRPLILSDPKKPRF